MNALSSLHREERGSLPLVLLAAIVMAGVVVALATTIQTGVNTARQDRNFNAAIHVADVGVQEAYVQLAALLADLEPEDTLPNELTGNGMVDGNAYEWVATRQPTGRYEVIARGQRGSEGRASERTIVAEMGPQILFPLALYADVSMVFNGLPSGTARAYDGDGNEVDIEYLLGSGGDITANGQCEEGVILHGPDATINRTCTPAPIDRDKPELDDFALAAYEDGGECSGGTNDAAFVAAIDAGELQRGTTYCISGFNFDRNDYINVVGSDSDPARIFVAADGSIDLRQGGSGPRINTGGVVPSPPASAPDSTALRVYMSGGTFSMGSNTYFAGVLWAPSTACVMGNGNTFTYGALVCGSFENNGNWSHWYDIRASNVTDGLLEVLRYQEEPGL